LIYTLADASTVEPKRNEPNRYLLSADIRLPIPGKTLQTPTFAHAQRSAFVIKGPNSAAAELVRLGPPCHS